ncbi:MAG: HAMP domain-containing sensor histidine kinase [Polyangiaceae bacterium]
MKIIPKLTLALVAGTCLILLTNGFLRVRREVAFFELDRLRDHEMIGRTLGASVAAVWKSEGEVPALQSIDGVNEHFTRIQVRWRAGAVGAHLHISPEALAATPSGQPITRVDRSDEGDPHWYTYVPLDLDGKRRGAIELSEPAAVEHQFARNVLVDTMTATLALVLMSALVSFAMGQWLVGAPVRLLAEKARRIGRGDFSEPIALTQRDELSDLAREMNGMCERLSATLDQLRHADRLATVGKLASGIAHELGTPLNVVSARAGMIASGDTSPEESKDYARVIVGATERMTKIIRQLLQFVRRSGPQKARHDLRQLAADTLDLLRPLADKSSVRLEMAPSTGDATILVDSGQLQQVVTNLVMNAIQAMPTGGVVTLATQTTHVQPPPDIGGVEAEYLCLSVEDVGEGIASDALSHIFEPFFTTKDVGQGTGLGLAVTYGIIRDHGGWIAVESKPKEGSAFRVFLPRNM